MIQSERDENEERLKKKESAILAVNDSAVTRWQLIL